MEPGTVRLLPNVLSHVTVLPRGPCEHKFGMQAIHAERLLKATKALRTSLLVVISQVDEISDLVESLPLDSLRPPVVAIPTAPLRLDRSTYSVWWAERSCPLGHTMAFRVIERLARSPNEYISTDRLLVDLWGATRTPSTVRSTVCGLKTKLRDAGLAELAKRIDGTTRGHYGLMLSSAHPQVQQRFNSR